MTITVESGTNTIEVYGSNTAYGSAFDLYNSGQGTRIGSLSETGTVDFSKQVEQYAYVGIRSSNGAVYLASVEIVWE